MSRAAATLGKRACSALIPFALAVSGCATSSLQIEVDLYESDPSLPELMEPEEARELIAHLTSLREEAERATAVRASLARESFAQYEAAWKLIGGNTKTSDAVGKRLQTYTDALEAQRKEIVEDLESAIDEVEAYVSSYATKHEALLNPTAKAKGGVQGGTPETHAYDAARGTQPAPTTDGDPKCDAVTRFFAGCTDDKPPPPDDREIRIRLARKLWEDEVKVHAAVADAVGSYERLGSVNVSFAPPWHDWEYLLNAKIQQARLRRDPRAEALYLGRAERVAESIQELAVRARRDVGVEPRRGRDTRDPARPSTLSRSVSAVGAELETLRNDLPESATSQTALGALVRRTARFTELIDRLQDAGDPAWREVSRSENADRWNRVFSKVYFYGEGDTSVVVVRDGPTRYRVQEATNDPRALIEGQLEISRTVANAAISMVGAVAGIPTEALASSAAGRTTDSKVEGTPDGLHGRRVSAEVREAERRAALASLRSYLVGIESAVRDLGKGDTTQLEAQQQRLRAVLRGHRPIFEKDQPEQ